MLLDENGRRVYQSKKTKIIDEAQILMAKSYLQGAVYGWCNSAQKEPFGAATFVGGGNYFWQGTPLYCLFNEYWYKYKVDEPSLSDEEIAKKVIKSAGQACGWLLKSVLIADKRTFKTRTDGFPGKLYEWDGHTDNDYYE